MDDELGCGVLFWSTAKSPEGYTGVATAMCSSPVVPGEDFCAEHLPAYDPEGQPLSRGRRSS